VGLHYKPFWIWNVDEYKQEDVRISGGCCFNHIIGLPQRNGVDVSGWKDTIVCIMQEAMDPKCMTTI
jgi:hypothetical protein